MKFRNRIEKSEREETYRNNARTFSRVEVHFQIKTIMNEERPTTRHNIVKFQDPEYKIMKTNNKSIQITSLCLIEKDIDPFFSKVCRLRAPALHPAHRILTSDSFLTSPVTLRKFLQHCLSFFINSIK